MSLNLGKFQLPLAQNRGHFKFFHECFDFAGHEPAIAPDRYEEIWVDLTVIK